MGEKKIIESILHSGCGISQWVWILSEGTVYSNNKITHFNKNIGISTQNTSSSLSNFALSS
jgi:hypothetical protein